MKEKIVITLFILMSIFTPISSLYADSSNIQIPYKGQDVGLSDFQDSEDNFSSEAKVDGAKQISGLLMEFVKLIQYILGFIASIWIVWQGALMIFAQGDETKFNEAKRNITYGIYALIGAFIVEPAVTIIYGGKYIPEGGGLFDPISSSGLLQTELGGILSILKTFIGISAVIMIIYTGIKAIFNAQSESALEDQNKSILWLVIGIIIIIFNEVLVYSGIYGEPTINPETQAVEKTLNITKVFSEAGGFINYILGLLAALAILIIIYGGFLYLSAAYDEQQAEKGKTIIRDVAVGFIIILISYTLIRTVILF